MSHGLFVRIENHGIVDLHSVFGDSSFEDESNLGLHIFEFVGEDNDVTDVDVVGIDDVSLFVTEVDCSVSFLTQVGDFRDVNRLSKCSFRSSFSSIVFSFVSSSMNPLSRPST